MRKGSATNPIVWQVNFDYIKSSLYYATLGRAFRNCFSFHSPPCINEYDDNENQFFVKPLSHGFSYKVTSTENIVHTYFSLLTLSVHSHLTQPPLIKCPPLTLGTWWCWPRGLREGGGWWKYFVRGIPYRDIVPPWENTSWYIYGGVTTTRNFMLMSWQLYN